MVNARRIYVYLLSGISLGVLLVGLSTLLRVLFQDLGLGTDSFFGDPTSNREQLTLGAALVAVGLPVWLIHWTLAERGVRPGRLQTDDELGSWVRGLYLAVVLAVLLGIAAANLSQLVAHLVYALAGASSLIYTGDVPTELAGLLVAGAAWGYHLFVRLGDWRRGRVADAGAWLPRLYLYGAIGVSLLVLLSSLSGLADLGIRAAVSPERTSFADTPWWASPLASSLSGVIVGGVVWTGHWWYAASLAADTSGRMPRERPARLRLAYFAGMLVVLAGVAIGGLVGATSALLRQALGLDPTSGLDQTLLETVATPLVVAVLFGIAWWLHRGWLAADVRSIAEPLRSTHAARLDSYGHALLGLAIAGLSGAWLIALAIEAAFGSPAILGGASPLSEQAAIATPAFVLGGVVSVWGWARIGARWRRDTLSEAGSSIRRAALLLIIGVSVVAAIGGLGVLFYRLFGTLFGVSLSSDVAGDLAIPIAALLVAAVAGLASGWAIRRDQAVRAAAAEPGPFVPATAGGVPPSAAEAASARVSVTLRLSGPDAGSMREAIEALRRALPRDVELELREPVTRPEP